ncbi:MAG: ATP-binding cassette domain-containing protein [Opitutales bacterium]|nr:ATP-binding cassette domain-containing protein [Opitutales bacterium]
MPATATDTPLSEKKEICLNTEAAAGASALLEVQDLEVYFGATPVLEKVGFSLYPRSIFGILGPSGKGKSTLLRCLNRLIDLEPSARVRGRIRFNGEDLLSHSLDVDALRARIGMLFQQPQVFPTSVEKNVLFGARRLRRICRAERPVLVERCLREAALWDQVKDRLSDPAGSLSVGQQQRLCLARTLATDPEIILLDEPTSALDTDTTAAIEETFGRLAAERSLVLVTHDPAQADRLAQRRLVL